MTNPMEVPIPERLVGLIKAALLYDEMGPMSAAANDLAVHQAKHRAKVAYNAMVEGLSAWAQEVVDLTMDECANTYPPYECDCIKDAQFAKLLKYLALS